MRAKLHPTGPGQAIEQLIATWDTPTAATSDYAAATLGQLKATAAPFYQRLGLPVPWSTTTTDDKDLAVANLGQAKQVFSFNIIAENSPGSFAGDSGRATSMAPQSPQQLGAPSAVEAPATPATDSDGDGEPDSTDAFPYDCTAWLRPFDNHPLVAPAITLIRPIGA